MFSSTKTVFFFPPKNKGVFASFVLIGKDDLLSWTLSLEKL